MEKYKDCVVFGEFPGFQNAAVLLLAVACLTVTVVLDLADSVPLRQRFDEPARDLVLWVTIQ